MTTYGGNVELTRFISRTDQEGRRLPPTLSFFSRLQFTICLPARHPLDRSKAIIPS